MVAALPAHSLAPLVGGKDCFERASKLAASEMVGKALGPGRIDGCVRLKNVYGL